MIEYVIISSDDNSLYKDFYEIVAKRWKELGFMTYYVNITNEDSITKNEYGIIHKIKSLDFVSTGFQSQVVRLFASKYINGNILTSDIDMLPIDGDYYNQYNNELTEDNVVIFSGQPYGNVPYYPMCYILSNASTLMNFLDIRELTFSDYCKLLIENYGEKWNTDEHFMYEKFQGHLSNLIIKKDRDFSRRVDRLNWAYDLTLLKQKYYIDSHLLRPYSEYKQFIDLLIKNL